MPNLPKITANDIRTYLDGILKTSSSSTYDRKLSSLRKFFSWAQKQGYFQENAVEDYLNQKENQIISKVVKAEQLNNQTVKNVSQPFYTSVQAKLISKFEGKPRIQNFLYKAFYLRPEWYKIYHNVSFTRYFHLAILTIFSFALVLGIYDQFKQNTTPASAYPTSLVSPKRYLSFQGRLTNQYGNPVTDATDVVFKLWNHATDNTEAECNGGGNENCLWSTQTPACSVDPDQDGIFNVLLGTTSGDDFTCAGASEITSDVFSENAEVWLGVKVASDSEATPRIQIATVAYALNAETLQGYPITATGSATRNSVVTMNDGGEILIGEAAPKIKSVSGNFLIQGEAMTLSTPNTSNGSIDINPDGTGSLNLTFEGAAPGGSIGGFVNATNANQTSKALYYGEVASDASGYDFIQFKSGSSPTQKFAVDNAGNTEMTGDLTVTGDDLFMGTNTDGYMLVADGTNFNPVAVSGDITITNTGVTAIGDNKVVEADLKAVDSASDEECLTYEETTGDFEWQTCGSVSTNYWQLNAEVLSPYNTTLDLAIGGTATASSKFQIMAETGNIYTANNTIDWTLNNAVDALNIDSNTLSIDALNDRVGIGTTTPTTGYKLDVAGNINTVQTVNQTTYPSVNATQTASTLQDGSAYTGTDATMATPYQAVQFTASADHTMGDFTIRIKEDTDITNTTAYITGYIYADDGGTPGKPTGAALATGKVVRYGTITSTYQTLSVGTAYTMVSGTKYWLVVKQSAAPVGGNIILDSDVSTNMGATSADGTTWTNNDVRLRYTIKGLTYYAVYGSSTNNAGVRGYSANSYGVYGSSTNYLGVLGDSINNYGVYGSSTNSVGTYGISTNNYGIRGDSTNSVGVGGISINSAGIYGNSTTGRAGYFYRNNTAGTATTAVLDVVQDSATSETNTVLRVQGDGTGDLVNIFDGATEVLTVLDGGNVGIGTTSPTSKFQIGPDTVTQVWSGSTPYVLIQGVDNEISTPALTVKDENLGTMFELTTTGDSTVGRAYFGGNVGIGTTGPDSPLDVLSTGGSQIRTTYTDGTVYSTFNTDSSGNLTIDNTGTKTIIADDLQITGDDLIMGTNTDGYMLVADGTNFNPVAMSGDITITNTGATAIGDNKVTEADLKVVDSATDEECLTYEETTGDFEWQSCTAIAADSLDFTDFSDTMSIDADTSIAFEATESLTFNAATADTTETGGVLDFNIDAGNADGVTGLNTDFAQSDGATSGYDATAQKINLSANDADGDVFGLTINALATANAAAGSYEAAIKIDNAENIAGSMTDGILITATTDTAITDAIDVSDAEIVNAINVGANTILGSTGIINYDNFDVDASGNVTVADLVITGGNINPSAALTLGDGGDTLTISTSDWDIDATGAMTNMSFDANGTGNSITNIESADIADGTIAEADLKVVDSATDEECLTYEETTGDFEWQNCEKYWTLNTNDLYSTSVDYKVGIGTTTPISRLHVATNTTTLTGKAALIIDQYEDQDIFTASASGTTVMKLQRDGTLSLINATSSISNTAGDITIDAASDNISFAADDISDIGTVTAGTGIFSDILQVNGSTATTYSRFGTATTDRSGSVNSGSDLLISGDIELNGVLYLDGRNISNAAGTGTILFTDAVTTGQNSLSSSSWLIENTANVGKAALTVNQTKLGDIFTASASGATKFVITNAGAVGVGTILPESQVQISGGGLCVGSDANCNSDNNTEGVVYSSSVNMTGYDLAEKYPTKDSSLVAGEIVEIDQENNVFVTRASSPYSKNILGVISTRPGLLLGGFNGQEYKQEVQVAVALSGRVPVKIDPSSDPIFSGDYLTASSLPGTAKKPNQQGYMIGKALEDWSPNSGKDTTMVFVSTAWADPITQLSDSGDFNILANNQIENEATPSAKYSVTDIAGELINSVNILSKLVVANVRAGMIETKELTADSFIAFQGTIDNLIVNSGLVSPSIKTEVISPIANSNITIDLENTATDSAEQTYGKLAINGEEGKEVASIDASGNATFSGMLQSDSVGTNDLIAGKIYADEIISRTGTFSDIYSSFQNGSSIEEIENILREAQDSLANLNSQFESNIYTASDSAGIKELNSEIIYVTDFAAVNSLIADRSITLGNDLTIQNDIAEDGQILSNSIDTISAPLLIQSLAMAPLEIMAGKFRIETDGNVLIDGNLYIAGDIESESLTLKPNQSVIDSGFGDLLSVKGINGDTVASVDASGSAKFNEISTDKLIIAGSETVTSDSLVDGLVTSTNATAGKDTLLANASQITIRNENITDNTLVYVTPTSSTMNNVLYVKSKGPGIFTVGFNQPVSVDVTFNWWVIDLINN